MEAMEALRIAAQNSGVALGNIGLSMGKSRQYVNAIMTKGNTPRTDTLARMLDVCGYGLYAIPYEQAPEGALRITAEGDRETVGRE